MAVAIRDVARDAAKEVTKEAAKKMTKGATKKTKRKAKNLWHRISFWCKTAGSRQVVMIKSRLAHPGRLARSLQPAPPH
jgi:hypothetical protein